MNCTYCGVTFSSYSGLHSHYIQAHSCRYHRRGLPEELSEGLASDLVTKQQRRSMNSRQRRRLQAEGHVGGDFLTRVVLKHRFKLLSFLQLSC